MIKSFGLQIGSVRAESKQFSFSEEKRTERRFKPIASLLNRTEKHIRAKQLLDIAMEPAQVEGLGVQLGRGTVSERMEKKPMQEEKI